MPSSRLHVHGATGRVIVQRLEKDLRLVHLFGDTSYAIFNWCGIRAGTHLGTANLAYANEGRMDAATLSLRLTTYRIRELLPHMALITSRYWVLPRQGFSRTDLYRSRC